MSSRQGLESQLANKTSWTRTAVWIVGLAVVAGGGYFAWRHFATSNAPAKSEAKAAPAPVTTAKVRKADFPVYLTGLGTAQPYDTVTVNSRVDGEITKIFFRQGQVVNEGDTLAQIDPRPYQAALDQAKAKKVADEANLKNAALNLARYKTLGAKEFASQQQVDTQQASVDQLDAQVKGDEAAIANAQTQVSYTTIKSPLTGKTGFRLVDPGNIVHASATTGIVTIVKLQPISVVFTAPEEEVQRINDALAAGAIPVEAWSSDGKTLLSSGHLALVNNAVDQASGDIRMKATFENKDNRLWPGLSVSTRLLVQTIKDATVAPADAVQRGPQGLFVYVLGPGNKVKMTDVKVGEESANLSLIESGLKDGDTVVVSGQSRLADGSVVDAKAGPEPEPTPSTAASAPAPAPKQPAAADPSPSPSAASTTAAAGAKAP
jgi:membrane fusion protein, multidrug efflux system